MQEVSHLLQPSSNPGPSLQPTAEPSSCLVSRFLDTIITMIHCHLVIHHQSASLEEEEVEEVHQMVQEALEVGEVHQGVVVEGELHQRVVVEVEGHLMVVVEVVSLLMLVVELTQKQVQEKEEELVHW